MSAAATVCLWLRLHMRLWKCVGAFLCTDWDHMPVEVAMQQGGARAGTCDV